MTDADLRAKRDALTAKLKAWNDPDEDKPVRQKTTKELLEESDRLAAEMKARDEADRIEAEVQRRVQERLEQERAKPKPIYRSTLSPKQKSEAMRKFGDKYLSLPWAPDRP